MIRLIPAVFGLGTIGLIFMLRRRLGTIATLSAALLLAVSPGAVYLSRYFIHETQFVFFTLGIVVFGLRFYDTRNPTWLVLASASAALLFATKETALISMGVLLIAFGLTHVYRRLFRKAIAQPSAKSRRPGAPQKGAFGTFLDDFGTTNLVIAGVIAAFVFVFLNVMFYSSFFRNSQGIYDALKTFDVWRKTGQTAHVHSPFQYIVWLGRQEAPLLFLGGIGRRSCCAETEKFRSAVLGALVVWFDRGLLVDSLQDAVAGVELHRSARVDCRFRVPGDL